MQSLQFILIIISIIISILVLIIVSGGRSAARLRQGRPVSLDGFLGAFDHRIRPRLREQTC